ncbi:hypothetical protein OK074_5491 [Actinobacteria bacterium OK074]|nr:hypothetical protein OK074_5491 [Actinobacteria bacterium OK074]
MNARDERAEPAYVPREGEMTADARTGRVGTAVRWDGSALTLRAPSGEEWTTETFRRPTTSEELGPRVAEANARSRRGKWGEPT